MHLECTIIEHMHGDVYTRYTHGHGQLCIHAQCSWNQQHADATDLHTTGKAFTVHLSFRKPFCSWYTYTYKCCAVKGGRAGCLAVFYGGRVFNDSAVVPVDAPGSLQLEHVAENELVAVMRRVLINVCGSGGVFGRNIAQERQRHDNGSRKTNQPYSPHGQCGLATR